MKDNYEREWDFLKCSYFSSALEPHSLSLSTFNVSSLMIFDYNITVYNVYVMYPSG